MKILRKIATKKLALIFLIVIIFALIPTAVLANYPPNFLIGLKGISNSHIYIGMFSVGNSNLWIGYKAWEGNTMTANYTFIGIILLAIVGSIFAIYKHNVLFAIGAAAAWFLLIAFTRSNPIATLGGNADTIFIGVCVAFSVATMITVFTLNEKAKKEENPPPDEHIVNRHNTRSSSYESADDYQARLASLKKKR